MKQGKMFMENMKNQAKAAINTAALAEVISYSNGYADIKLFPDGIILQSVPVSAQHFGQWMMSVEVSQGDMVAVVFSQHEIDGLLEGTGVATNREKDINDAVIVGAVRSSRMPPVASKGIYLGDSSGNKSVSITNGSMALKMGGTSFVMTESGVTLTTPTQVVKWE